MGRNVALVILYTALGEAVLEGVSSRHPTPQRATWYTSRNSHDSADYNYTSSMRTERWYLQIFFWLLDRVVRQLCVTVICAKWKDYLEKSGRKRFQIDIARESINYAIDKSWTNLDSAKPDWMRRAAVLRNKCCFCLHSLTTGIERDHTCTKTIDCTDKPVDLKIGTLVTFLDSVTENGQGRKHRRWRGFISLAWAACHVKNVFINCAGIRVKICTRRSVLDGAVVHWILFVVQTFKITHTWSQYIY